MANFFFVISNRKFQRIDFDSITYVTEMKGCVQLHTDADVYAPVVSIQKIKELLPYDQFIWIDETTAIPRVIPNNNR